MAPTRSVLVVGGTGPTGTAIVRRFIDAGLHVTVYHTGRHEGALAKEVEHIHGDPRSAEDIHRQLESSQWDVAICTSGRLRLLATELAGKATRLVGITGQPVYRGTMRPTPEGTVMVPVPETADRQSDADNYTGRVAIGEDQVLEQHRRGDFEGVIVRYPGVYGEYGHLNHEWAIVKRVLDGRTRMAMPNGGATYFQRGYAENLGQLVFLSATRAEAAGEVFNGGDERVMNGRQVAQVILDELEYQMEVIDIPSRFVPGTYPLAQKSSIVLDMSKARELLGYRDVVDVEQATRLTARWLRNNPDVGRATNPAFGGSLEYEHEDQALDWYIGATAQPPRW